MFQIPELLGWWALPFGALAYLLILITLGFWVLFEPEAGDGQVATTAVIIAAALVEILIYGSRLEWSRS